MNVFLKYKYLFEPSLSEAIRIVKLDSNLKLNTKTYLVLNFKKKDDFLEEKERKNFNPSLPSEFETSKT